MLTYRDLFEVHNIACQCSSLVGKYGVDHAELFIKVRSMNLTEFVFLFTLHAQVPLDKQRLEKLSELNVDDQRYGYKIEEDQGPCTEGLKHGFCVKRKFTHISIIYLML